MNDEPKLEVSNGGRTVSIEIYRLEGETSWALDVIDEHNNSTAWDDTFKTELPALSEAKKLIEP